MDYTTKQKLLDYIEKQFPEPMKYSFTRDLISNIIDYADNNMPEDMKVYHIAEMIPEITAAEISRIIEEE